MKTPATARAPFVSPTASSSREFWHRAVVYHRRPSLAPFSLALSAACVSSHPSPSAAPLTLDDAIRLALDKNRNIKVEDFSRGIARANLLAAYGQFDPSINFARSYSESNSLLTVDPLLTQLELVKTDNYNLSLDGVMPWGLNYSIQVGRRRTSAAPTIISPTITPPSAASASRSRCCASFAVSAANLNTVPRGAGRLAASPTGSFARPSSIRSPMSSSFLQ